MAHDLQTRRWGWLVLFASLTTLVCCALPILLVSLGMGAVWAAIYANVGAVGFIAQHELWFFIGSGVLLLLAGYTLFHSGRSCPADPVLAAKCRAADVWNRRLLFVAALVWTTGFVASYLLVPLSQFFGG